MNCYFKRGWEQILITWSSEADSIKRLLPTPGKPGEYKGAAWAECFWGLQLHRGGESVLHTILWWSTYSFLWFCPLSWLKVCNVYTATQNKWKHGLLFKLCLADITVLARFIPFLIDNNFLLFGTLKGSTRLPPLSDASFTATSSIPGQEVRVSLEIIENLNNKVILYMVSLGSPSLPILLFTLH